MLETRFQDFTVCVWDIARRVGMKPPVVADAVIGNLFPNTKSAAEDEGADKMLRNGVIRAVRRVLRSSSADDAQADMSAIHPSFRPFVEPLGSSSYFVEALEEQVPISILVETPDLLDDARKYMRRKGLECIAEADRLDALYEAVSAPILAV